MKKVLFVLLVIGLLAGTVAGCGAPGETPDDTVAEPKPEPTPEPTPAEPPSNLILEADGPDGYGGTVVNELPGNLEAPNDNDVKVLPGSLLDDYPEFLPGTGIITKKEIVNNLTRIEIEAFNGDYYVFMVNEKTVFPFSKDFAVGDEVTGWFLNGTPYGQLEYDIYVLVSRMGDDRNIKVDRFHASDTGADRNFISNDKMLMFSIDEKTEIILADGKDFSSGNLDDRCIVVIYEAASTMGGLEQATAEKLIVLPDDIRVDFGF